MASLNLLTIFYGLLGGVLPCILWLFFWLEEDRLHPEPRRYILYAFLGGMVAIPFAIYIEGFIGDWFESLVALGNTDLIKFSVWAAVEEIVKFTIAYLIVLRTRIVDEPIDYVIYLITVALGFAALENTLFLIGALLPASALYAVQMTSLRFVGATLLHVLASGTLGAAMAFAFYKPKYLQKFYAAAGLILAIALHAAFNLFIILSKNDQILYIFAFVWITIIILMFAIERIKRLGRTS